VKVESLLRVNASELPSVTIVFFGCLCATVVDCAHNYYCRICIYVLTYVSSTYSFFISFHSLRHEQADSAYRHCTSCVYLNSCAALAQGRKINPLSSFTFKYSTLEINSLYQYLVSFGVSCQQHTSSYIGRGSTTGVAGSISYDCRYVRVRDYVCACSLCRS
jgi:hypothetical protein